MDVDKILILNNGEYFLSKKSFDQTTAMIRSIYEDMQPHEKLVVEMEGSESKFEVSSSMGGGIIVAEHNEKDGKHIAGLRVTIREEDTRIDDPNQVAFMSGGVLFIYHGILDQSGEVSLYTKNSNKKKLTQVDRLLNQRNTHVASWLKPVEICGRYKEAVSTAIRVLKNLPQS